MEPSILSLLNDNQGNIWFGTYNGLYTYNPHLDKLSFYNYNQADTLSLSGTIITSLYQDSKNRIWAVAMDRGLNLFHPGNKTFTHYTHSADGLLDNNITAITELPSGHLLLGTSAGLSILDPEKDNSLTTITKEVFLLPWSMTVHSSYPKIRIYT